MQSYQITILSKNEKSLKNYLKILYKNIGYYKLTTKLSNKQKKKFFVTILKSPHVNKKAQEQFGYNIFSKQLFISFYNSYKFIFFIKKIEKNLFSDIIIKIKLQLNKNLSNKLTKKFFNPDNFKTYFFKDNLLVNKKNKKFLVGKNELFQDKTKYLFKIFDIYGEITQQNLLFR